MCIRDRGKDVHLLELLLQLLLVLHTETLLLVHHQQPQILELHILIEQAVSANQDIDRTVLHLTQCLLHLGGGTEPVSYTHLFWRDATKIELSKADRHSSSSGAVSYTHLDVYKRQSKSWSTYPKNT